jgi:hypothetical protein
MKLKTEMHQLTEGTNDFFDITEETKLLTEIKDIQDEINIILTVLKDQRTVLTDMIHENRNNGMLPDSSVSAVNLKLAESEFKEQYPMVDKNIKDFERMEERSQRAYSTVNTKPGIEFAWANAQSFTTYSI